MSLNNPPYKFLQTYIGKNIKVGLKNSEDYEGSLYSVDCSKHEGIGNIALKNAKKTDNSKEKFDWLLIRGDNIFFIYLQ
jgi:small nuclear ribonucleoprotein (snRNP)-like protein